MAKRKRLSAPNPMFLDAAGTAPAASPAPGPRVPIADVAGDSSAAAALDEVTRELTQAREDGRLLARLPLARVQLDYLVRDRVALDDEDMQALVASIAERGQQTPIEVVALDGGDFGLISGWRRCQALAQLAERGLGDGTVLAIERRPEGASDAYRAMVEENEIRAGLSYFERARIVHVAVAQGVYKSQKEALQSLFSAASRPRRSKIGSFVTVVQALGDCLRFPRAIGERLGLRLSKLIETHPAEVAALVRDLRDDPSPTPEQEQARLSRWAAQVEQAGRPPAPRRALPETSTPRPGLSARYHPESNKLELSGKALTEDMHRALMAWLKDWS